VDGCVTSKQEHSREESPWSLFRWKKSRRGGAYCGDCGVEATGVLSICLEGVVYHAQMNRAGRTVVGGQGSARRVLGVHSKVLRVEQ